MMGKSTIVALFQAATAFVYLLLEVVSYNAYDLMSGILFEAEGFYGGPYGNPFRDSLSFISLALLPLVMGAVGLVVFYGLMMEDKNAWKGSLILNLVGFLAVAMFFIPVVAEIQRQLSDPFLHFYLVRHLPSIEALFGILYYSVPLALILSFTVSICSGIVTVSDMILQGGRIRSSRPQ